MARQNPTFKRERQLLQEGYLRVVGVDEAGAGALAGPIVAGAAVLPFNSRLGALMDSKLTTEKQREVLYEAICTKATAWAVGIATAQEIVQLGLRPANLLAMRRAVEGIEGADFALVDAWTIRDLQIPQEGIIRGDKLVKSIAAASILAKVTRDRMMKVYSAEFPQYQFEKHKGYGTALHRKLIEEYGPCEIHRVTYKLFQNTLI